MLLFAVAAAAAVLENVQDTYVSRGMEMSSTSLKLHEHAEWHNTANEKQKEKK